MFKLLLAGIFALAQVQGELVDLEKALNARDKAYFYGTENIKFTLPKGTKAKIEEVRKFASGNSGLLIEVQEGPRKGEKVWIHFNPKSPSVSCNGKACAGAPEKEDKVVTKRSVPAIKSKTKDAVTVTFVGGSKPAEKIPEPRESAKPDKKASETPASEKVEAKVQEATVKMRGLESSKNEPCSDGKCDVAHAGDNEKKSVSIMTGSERTTKCEDKSEVFGSIKVRQSFEEGRCRIAVYKASEGNGPRQARSFEFRADGELEMVDPSGARQLRLFPRVKDLSYSVNSDRTRLTVQTVSNMAITFNTQTGAVEKVDGARSYNYRAYSSAGKADKWGDSLSIVPDENGLVLDTGYEAGVIPEQHSNRSSLIRRGDGQTCTLANPLLYNYTNPNGSKRMNYDPSIFRFKNDSEFEQMYESKCKWK